MQNSMIRQNWWILRHLSRCIYRCLWLNKSWWRLSKRQKSLQAAATATSMSFKKVKHFLLIRACPDSKIREQLRPNSFSRKMATTTGPIVLLYCLCLLSWNPVELHLLNTQWNIIFHLRNNFFPQKFDATSFSHLSKCLIWYTLALFSCLMDRYFG